MVEKNNNVLASCDFIIDNINDGVVILSLDGTVLKINKSLLKLGGYSVSEVVGKKAIALVKIFPKKSILKIAKSFVDAARGVPHDRYNLDALDKDGNPKVLRISNSLVKDSEGNTYVVVITQDVTDEEKTDKETAALSIKLKSLVDVLGEIVYEHFVEEKKIVWSGSLVETLGYSEKTMGVDDKSWVEKVHPDDLTKVAHEFDDASRERRIFDIEYRFRKQDGKYIWVHDRGVMFFDGKGKLIKVLGIMLNVNDQRNRLNILNERTRDLERMNQLMVGREMKMIELKKKIKELEEELKKYNQ